MKTLERFLREPPQIPMATVWLLSDLAEYRGKQDLFSKQSPQKLARPAFEAMPTDFTIPP